jgi:hypothetical protein
VIGTGFIACEAASNLTKTFAGKKQVSIILSSNVPLEK